MININPYDDDYKQFDVDFDNIWFGEDNFEDEWERRNRD